MKKTIFILSILCSSLPILAQNSTKSFARIEISRANTDLSRTSDMWGTGAICEYSRYIASHSRLAIGISTFNFSYPNYHIIGWGPSLNIWATGIEMGYYQTFFNKFKVQVELGGGIFNRYNTFSNNWDSYTYKSRHSSFGYTSSLGLLVPLKNNCVISLRGVFQNDENLDLLGSIRMGFGCKF
ncbi:MAG: hypothetical protein IT244_09260 [Bacteroidia bacterium]|nr:hypothetical protein [Bacteroidia bacterium]